VLQWLYTYLVSVCFHCFICFLDVCCKCVYLDVAYVSHICCKCFTWMLRMFAMVFKCFHMFLQLFQTHVLSVSSVFRCMLQVLHLDVSKVDRDVAHVARTPMASEQWPAVGFPSSRGALHPLLYSPFPSIPSISMRQFEPDECDARGGGGPMSMRRW
jgi:hypothetical protein